MAKTRIKCRGIFCEYNTRHYSYDILPTDEFGDEYFVWLW